MPLPVIEQGVPLPRRAGGKPGWIILLRSMEVGDSFLVHTAIERNLALSSLSKARAYGAEGLPEGMELTSRKVEGGFRIWRTK